jgi:hypothetical protein
VQLDRLGHPEIRWNDDGKERKQIPSSCQSISSCRPRCCLPCSALACHVGLALFGSLYRQEKGDLLFRPDVASLISFTDGGSGALSVLGVATPFSGVSVAGGILDASSQKHLSSFCQMSSHPGALGFGFRSWMRCLWERLSGTLYMISGVRVG